MFQMLTRRILQKFTPSRPAFTGGRRLCSTMAALPTSRGAMPLWEPPFVGIKGSLRLSSTSVIGGRLPLYANKLRVLIVWSDSPANSDQGCDRNPDKGYLAFFFFVVVTEVKQIYGEELQA